METFIIIDNDKEVGVFSCSVDCDHVLIQNMYIRGRYNLCKLRSFLRETYPGLEFHWKNRKRGRYVVAS